MFRIFTSMGKWSTRRKSLEPNTSREGENKLNPHMAPGRIRTRAIVVAVERSFPLLYVCFTVVLMPVFSCKTL